MDWIFNRMDIKWIEGTWFLIEWILKILGTRFLKFLEHDFQNKISQQHEMHYGINFPKYNFQNMFFGIHMISSWTSFLVQNKLFRTYKMLLEMSFAEQYKTFWTGFAEHKFYSSYSSFSHIWYNKRGYFSFFFISIQT